MKMSLCKVHLGRFQYCLDVPQLLKRGLLEAAWRPDRAAAPALQGIRSGAPAGWGAGGGRGPAAPSHLRVPPPGGAPPAAQQRVALQTRPPASASVWEKHSDLPAFLLGFGLQVQVLATPHADRRLHLTA